MVLKDLSDKICPFWQDLRKLDASTIKSDFLAGLSVAPVAVPQAMAYAVVAGISPQHGLFAAAFVAMVVALWGSSRYVVSGPTNAIAMMLFFTIANASVGGVQLATLSPTELMPYVFAIAFLAGLIQLVMGIVRFGELANFISHSVMAGFTLGTAILIASGQLPNFFGFDIGKDSNFFHDILAIFVNIPNLNPWTFVLGVLSIAIVLWCKRISKRIPAYFVSIFLTSLVAYILDLKASGVLFVAEIPAEFPPMSMPNSLGLEVIGDLFYPAMAIAILGTVESLAVAKNLASMRRETIDANQELIGQGLGNIVAALTSGMPGSGSFSRSILNFSSGAKSRFAAVFSGLLTLFAILFCAPLAGHIPMAALAGMLLVIAWGMVDVGNIRLCCKSTHIDRVVFITTLLATLVLHLEKAIFLGVLLSLILLVYKEAHPRLKKLVEDDFPSVDSKWCIHSKHIAAYFVEGTLFFGAVQNLEKLLAEPKNEEVKVVMLILTRVFWIDASGAQALLLFARRCIDVNVQLILVTNDDSIQETLKYSGIVEYIGDDFIVSNVDDGLEKAKILLVDKL